MRAVCILLRPKHLQTSIQSYSDQQMSYCGFLMDHSTRVGIRLDCPARQAVNGLLFGLILDACMIQSNTLSRWEHPHHSEKEAVFQLTHL